MGNKVVSHCRGQLFRFSSLIRARKSLLHDVLRVLVCPLLGWGSAVLARNFFYSDVTHCRSHFGGAYASSRIFVCTLSRRDLLESKSQLFGYGWYEFGARVVKRPCFS